MRAAKTTKRPVSPLSAAAAAESGDQRQYVTIQWRLGKRVSVEKASVGSTLAEFLERVEVEDAYENNLSFYTVKVRGNLVRCRKDYAFEADGSHYTIEILKKRAAKHNEEEEQQQEEEEEEEESAGEN